MTVADNTERDKRCRAAASVLGLLQVITAFSYIVELANRWHEPIDLVDCTTALSPILLLFLVRRSCALVGLLAPIVVTDFLGRIFLEDWPMQANWAGWLHAFFGLISAALVAIWALPPAVKLLIDLTSGLIKRTQSGRK